MKKSAFAMVMVAVLILVGCGESKDSSESSVSAESNATKSLESNNLGANQSAVSKDSSADSKDSSADSKDSPQTTANLPANLAKNPQDLYKKCIACHGARGDKVAPGSAGSILIADLSKQILIDDMKGYRAKTLSRGGTSAIMYLQANGLSDDDIEILAVYISNFKK